MTMKKLSVLSVLLAVPLALSHLAVVMPQIVFLVASIFLPLPTFIFENAIIAGAALISTLLFGVAFGGNATNALLTAFIVAL